VSAAFYTSYETSLALREAGAEQGYGSAYYAIPAPAPMVMSHPMPPGLVPRDAFRAFRLDEILDALIAVGPLRVHGGSDGWYVYLCDEADEHRSAMPVEAAAACYLAVLRAAREARP
jgi:hypothetical protein